VPSRYDDAVRRSVVRDTNERLEEAGLSLRSNGTTMIVFHCECGDRACTKRISLTRSEYESARSFPARFVIARNHENPEDERVVSENARFAIVETVTTELSKLAVERNPRWQRGGPW
jgi:hypothetical protein